MQSGHCFSSTIVLYVDPCFVMKHSAILHVEYLNPNVDY